MKPTNTSSQSTACNPVSSECVIYNNQALPTDCFEICVGDSVGDVLFGLGTILCEFIATEYEVCGVEGGKTISEMFTSIGNRLCALENADPPEPITPFTCTDVKGCAWAQTAITDEGDTLEEVIDAIATAVEENSESINDTITPTLADYEIRITALEDAPEPTFPEPQIIPACVLPAVPTDISVVLAALEEQFCTLKTLIGDDDDLILAVARQCLNLGSDTQLSASGTMSSLSGWNSSPTNLAESAQNLWLTICDIRSAIKDIKLNCCDTACADFTWTISSTIDASGTQIVFYFDQVVIPSGYNACNAAGASFVVKDSLNNSYSFNVPIQNYAGTMTPYTILVSSTPLNPDSNYTVTINSCFINSGTGLSCERNTIQIIENPAACPEVVYTPASDSIAYEFTGVAGMSYTISVYGVGSPSELITSVTHANVIGGVVSGTITGLSSEVEYDLVMTVLNPNSGSVSTCPTVTVETLTGS